MCAAAEAGKAAYPTVVKRGLSFDLDCDVVGGTKFYVHCLRLTNDMSETYVFSFTN